MEHSCLLLNGSGHRHLPSKFIGRNPFICLCLLVSWRREAWHLTTSEKENLALGPFGGDEFRRCQVSSTTENHKSDKDSKVPAIRQ